MKILRLFLIIIELIPLNNHLFYPFPPYFHPSFHVCFLLLLSLSTETFHHCHKLWYEICYSTQVSCHIVFYYVQSFEFRRILMILNCLRSLVFHLVMSITVISSFCLSHVLSVMRMIPILLLTSYWTVSLILFLLILCDLVFKSDHQMLEFINFLNVLSHVNRLGTFSLVILKFSLTFLKSLSEFVMNLSHLGNMHLLTG